VGHTHQDEKVSFSLRGNVVLDLSVLLGRKRTPHQTGVSSPSPSPLSFSFTPLPYPTYPNTTQFRNILSERSSSKNKTSLKIKVDKRIVTSLDNIYDRTIEQHRNHNHYNTMVSQLKFPISNLCPLFQQRK